ncbi:flavin monoamine oxidase family protein [Oceanospirillum sanctuarii]|uniref:flavin monoamine oxidase family protein n=1 Tax=Oceanospirillum sanctuarii TaxID=1434821 RepID=UPI000A3B5E94|nr:FAD-dependent oxidoreductase [Oceanospirillum sanctuarii]
MIKARVAIIGGGVSGLYAAMLLEQKGISDYVLIEARDYFGGRVLSEPSMKDHIDLGATWFWPALQPDFAQVVKDLGLTCTEQYQTGDILLEHTGKTPLQKSQGIESGPKGFRIIGGMGSIAAALIKRLRYGQRVLNTHVTGLKKFDRYIDIEAKNSISGSSSYRVDQVFLAVPPRLAVQNIAFTPELPSKLKRQWSECPTWMAPHAKYLAVFNYPFWRDGGLSGAVRSSKGPLIEIYDASGAGYGALFGFVGLPPHKRSNISDEEIQRHCRMQLARLFGIEGSFPLCEFYKDWASDPFTAVAEDLIFPAISPSKIPSVVHGAWEDKLVGIASEWSPLFPGYLAGAVDAAQLGVNLRIAAGKQYSLMN